MIKRGIGASGAFSTTEATAGSCCAGISLGALAHGHESPQQQISVCSRHGEGASDHANAGGIHAHSIITMI